LYIEVRFSELKFTVKQ